MQMLRILSVGVGFSGFWMFRILLKRPRRPGISGLRCVGDASPHDLLRKMADQRQRRGTSKSSCFFWELETPALEATINVHWVLSLCVAMASVLGKSMPEINACLTDIPLRQKMQKQTKELGNLAQFPWHDSKP